LLVAVPLLAALVSISSPALAQDEGWSVSPGEVTVTGIRLGESASFPITLLNNNDYPLSISLAAELPLPHMIRPGYIPIPDTGWIGFDPVELDLAPHSRQEVTVRVAIPSQEGIGGKNYECWLSATSTGSGMVQIALSSRLLLSTSTTYVQGTNWYLIASIIAITITVGGVIYGNRREILRWLKH